MRVTVYPVRRVVAWLRAAGHDADAALVAAGIAPSEVVDDHALIPEEAWGALLVEAGRRTGDDMPGVALALASGDGDAGLLGYLFVNHPTLGAAVRAIATWFAAFRPGAEVRVEEVDGEVRVRFELGDGLGWRQHELHELIVMSAGLGRRGLDGPWSPTAVHLSVAPPDAGRLARAVGAPVVAPSFMDGLVFPAADAERAFPRADAQLLVHLRGAAEAHIARLRESLGAATRLLTLTGATVDLAAGVVWRGDTALRLTTRERELLGWLAQNANRVVSAAELERDLWGLSSAVLTFAPAVAIRRLRAKIEPDPAQPVNLLTVRGDGWRLVVGPQG